MSVIAAYARRAMCAGRDKPLLAIRVFRSWDLVERSIVGGYWVDVTTVTELEYHKMHGRLAHVE